MTDAADIIPPAAELSLSEDLARFEDETGVQFVVVTVTGLGGMDVADYALRLGEEWGVGSAEEDNGLVLLVAPNERKVNIEVGHGLEGEINDSFAFFVIEDDILPRFREGDLPGGIRTGADALMAQLALPPEEATANLARARERHDAAGSEGGIPIGLVWLILIVAINVWAMSRRGRRGRRRGPVIIWGPGSGSWGGRSSGGFGGGFGGGGFSGGGGSFGGGGASGGW